MRLMIFSINLLNLKNLTISFTSTMKLFGCFSTFLLLSNIFVAVFCEKIMKIRMKSIICKDVTPSIYNGSMSCSLKPTRDGSGLTSALYNFRKPASDIWIHFKGFFKYGTIYRSYLLDLDIDFCASMEIVDTLPYHLKLMFNAINKVSPEALHDCPYIGIEGYRNVTVENTINEMLPQMIPKGEYKILFRAHTKANITWATGTIIFILDAVEPLKSMKMGKK